MENSGRGFELLQKGDADGLRQLLEQDPAPPSPATRPA
jgi:hypothetical protein